MVVMGRKERTDMKDKSDKVDFPGDLCRAAFAILAMFYHSADMIVFQFLPSI